MQRDERLLDSDDDFDDIRISEKYSSWDESNSSEQMETEEEIKIKGFNNAIVNAVISNLEFCFDYAKHKYASISFELSENIAVELKETLSELQLSTIDKYHINNISQGDFLYLVNKIAGSLDYSDELFNKDNWNCTGLTAIYFQRLKFRWLKLIQDYFTDREFASIPFKIHNIKPFKWYSESFEKTIDTILTHEMENDVEKRKQLILFTWHSEISTLYNPLEVTILWSNLKISPPYFINQSRKSSGFVEKFFNENNLGNKYLNLILDLYIQHYSFHEWITPVLFGNYKAAPELGKSIAESGFFSHAESRHVINLLPRINRAGNQVCQEGRRNVFSKSLCRF